MKEMLYRFEMELRNRLTDRHCTFVCWERSEEAAKRTFEQDKMARTHVVESMRRIAWARA